MTTTNRDPASAPADDGPRAGNRSRAGLWLLGRRVHFVAGFTIAPFLAILALTGLAYAFTPQLNDVLYGDTLYVESRSDDRHPLSTQVDAAIAAHPRAHVKSVVEPADPERTTQVVLGGVPGLQEAGGPFDAESLTVYVDPYTADVTGELVTVNDRTPAQEWLRTLHSSLHLGTPGHVYSEFVASWLPFVVAGGLVLWIGRQRPGRPARTRLLPSRGLSGRARSRSWHGALGLWLAAGLLAVSVTGLTWSTYAGDRVDAAITALDGKSPSLSPPEVNVAADGAPIGVDRALTIARAEGLAGRLTLTPPPAAGDAFEVAESAEGLPIRKTSVAIDPYTEQVTARLGWEDYPLLAKLTTIGIAAHSGTLFGLANQLLMAALAIGALTMMVLAYRMWWHRRPTRGGLAHPPPVWRALPRPTLLVVIVVAGLLGWAMPVFGISLAAFVLIDSARNAIGSRRTPAGAAQPD